MRNYDFNTTADIIDRLQGRSGYNYNEELQTLRNKIGSDIYNNFQAELNERLDGGDYDSETVVGDSLNEAGEQYFRPINYQIRRNMRIDSLRMSESELIEKYSGRDYKTASDENIAQYAYFLTALNNTNFYF